MFCPRCSAQNELQQGYCRQCGQALSGVRLALEGSTDQSLEKLKASQRWTNGGSAILVVFTLIGLAITLLGFALSAPTLSNIALINLLLGLIIGLPLLFVGKLSLNRAVRLLSKSQTESSHSVLDQIHQANKLLTTDLKEDSHRLAVPGSVTEHTTLDLKESQSVHRKPS